PLGSAVAGQGVPAGAARPPLRPIRAPTVLRRSSDPAFSNDDCGDLNRLVDVQLIADVIEMAIHGVMRDAQLLGSYGHGSAVNPHAEDLQFTVSQGAAAPEGRERNMHS